MQVQRINVNVVKGNEVDEEVELEQLFNKADKAIAPMQVLEDEPKDRAENLIKKGNLFTDRLLKSDLFAGQDDTQVFNDSGRPHAQKTANPRKRDRSQG